MAPYCVGVAPFMALYACIQWLIIPLWDPMLQRYGHTPCELIRSGFADEITIYIALKYLYSDEDFALGKRWIATATIGLLTLKGGYVSEAELPQTGCCSSVDRNGDCWSDEGGPASG